jgi:hypothetical protein
MLHITDTVKCHHRMVALFAILIAPAVTTLGNDLNEKQWARQLVHPLHFMMGSHND